MSRAILAFWLAFWLALSLPLGALAQPVVDQDGAQTLQHDLQAWFAGLLGPDIGAAAERLRVTAEETHFRVELPFADARGQNAIAADVRPLDGGRWGVDALHLPADSRFDLQMPEPGGPPGAKVPAHFALHIGTQQGHALIDPALASPSRLDIDLGNVGLETDTARQHQEQHIDRYTVQATLQPDRGRLDLLELGTIVGWRSASRVGDRPAVGFGADRLEASARIDGIDPAHAAALLNAATGMLATLPPAAAAQRGNMALSAPERAALRALIESLRQIVTGVEGQETIDGLHIAVAGWGETTVRHATLGLSGVAPDGMLRATLTIGLDGLTVANLPPTAEALMPHHLTLQPSVSGVSLAALTTLALAATDQAPDHTLLDADTAALWASGGMTFGLDTMDMDIGPAALHGHGSVRLTGPDEYDAHARITATGLDTLMEQAAGNPKLQQALPLLAMARGFARPEGDHLVWDIVANRAGVTVNGVPLRGGPQPPDKP
ncbi:MAG TPA: hypothetical protein VMB34_20870 [Acetobacteraceae bacterium]|nr:hypothetical protein [Acetobacteraceae bacterium]